MTHDHNGQDGVRMRRFTVQDPMSGEALADLADWLRERIEALRRVSVDITEDDLDRAATLQSVLDLLEGSDEVRVAEERAKHAVRKAEELREDVQREIADIRSGRATILAGIADRLELDVRRSRFAPTPDAEAERNAEMWEVYPDAPAPPPAVGELNPDENAA